MMPSLPASTTRPSPSSAGALEPRSVSPALSSSWLVGVKDWRRDRPGKLSSSTLSPKSVAPFQGPLPVSIRMRPLAGSGERSECLRFGWLDHRAAAREDRRVARRAGARLLQFAAVGAQRVEHAQRRPLERAISDHVALVGRGVAEVAAGRREDVGTVDVERRGELLVGGSRVTHTGQEPLRVLAAVGERELVDQPVGRGGVHEQPVRVGERARGGDLRAARPAAVARRRERPQDLAAVGVDRDRLAVCGRDDDHVVHGALDGHAVQVDRRGVDGAGERHGDVAQVRDVGGGDAGGQFADVAALRIQAELGPVEQLAAEARVALGIAVTLTVGVGTPPGVRAAAGAQQHARRRCEAQAGEAAGAHRASF